VLDGFFSRKLLAGLCQANILIEKRNVLDGFASTTIFVANQITMLSFLQEEGCRWTYLKSTRSPMCPKKQTRSTEGTLAQKLIQFSKQ
jgi:hypothetical protein